MGKGGHEHTISIRENIPQAFRQSEAKRNNFEICESTMSLNNKDCPLGKLVNQSLTNRVMTWGRETVTPATETTMSHQGGVGVGTGAKKYL